MSGLADFTTDFISSADGARIGYRKIGSGPGVMLVHGGLQSSLNFTSLARALSTDFTVYIPDRRGRGLSSPYGDNDGLLSEAGDMLTLVRQANIHNIFGLSSGAIISLQAALSEPALQKVALYEPPIPIGETSFEKLDKDYEDAMREGNLGKAMLTILKWTGDSSVLRLLPAFITAPVMNVLIKAQKKSKNDDEVPLRDLIPTFHYDRIVAKESGPLMGKVKNMQAAVLLLGGSRSQSYLTRTLDRLYSSIPGVRRVQFEKEGHLAADNSGRPQEVAKELLNFYSSSSNSSRRNRGDLANFVLLSLTVPVLMFLSSSG